MVLVLGLVSYAHEYQYHDVGGEVGQRVDGIGYHGGGVAYDASRKLYDE